MTIIALIAIAALGAAVAGFVIDRPKGDAPLRSQITGLQNALARAHRRLAGEQRSIERLQAASRNAAISRLQTQMHLVTTCLPDAMAYVEGLSPTGAWVLDRHGNRLMKYPISIRSGVRITPDCSPLLGGTGSGR
jgi:hypothetical protein